MPYPVPILAHALPFNVIVGGTYGKRNRTVLPGDADLAHADCPSHSEYDRPPARRQISPLSCEQKRSRCDRETCVRASAILAVATIPDWLSHSFIPINMCSEASPARYSDMGLLQLSVISRSRVCPLMNFNVRNAGSDLSSSTPSRNMSGKLGN